jgi:hypothetical protein
VTVTKTVFFKNFRGNSGGFFGENPVIFFQRGKDRFSKILDVHWLVNRMFRGAVICSRFWEAEPGIRRRCGRGWRKEGRFCEEPLPEGIERKTLFVGLSHFVSRPLIVDGLITFTHYSHCLIPLIL